uniref:LINE-1 retrotransposable element ORF1 protein n=1 Tax=Equus caballus TaxID=9796 RepID=A0A9L0SM42_HORSE
MCKKCSSTIQQFIKAPDHKENNKNTELSPEDLEIGKLSENEFSVAIIKKLNEVKGNIEKQVNEFWSYFTKEIETIKKNQTEMLEMKSTMDPIKQNMDSLNARVDTIEEQISIIEDRQAEWLQTEEERELRIKKNEQNLRQIADSMRKSNLRIIGIPEGVEKENGAEGVLKEIIEENFPNLRIEGEMCVEEDCSSPRFVNVKRPAARHIVVQMAKMNDRERILRAARQKKISYKGTPIRLSADFSGETIQARREWNGIFNTLKNKNLQPRILYPAKISFRYEGEIKSFPDKQKLRDFVTKIPPLQEILKKVLMPEKRKMAERGHKSQSRETNR